ncbi:MAG: hypothetical protein A2542_02270 [Parcubacteria group bacterium RIFOXYD2_FULL_52_8]|nr:MAG: hypothetical protein A2542_02270 [Parcubacteria group bacterium RIFOXYD2_FULL_52_8]
MEEINEKVTLLIDESYDNNFCGVCVVAVQGDKNLEILRDQIRQMAIDPMLNAYNKSGIFHYSDNGISGRQALATWISRMPISAYIALSTTNVPDLKGERDNIVYRSFLPQILKLLRMKYTKRAGDISFAIKFENLSNKSNSDLVFFKEIVGKIPSCRDTEVNVVTKDKEPLTFLPDYFLGFIRDHLTKQYSKEGAHATWPTDSLKLLSGKIGLILQCDETRIKHYGRGKQVTDFLT